MKILLLVDIQNDFADKDGALYVPHGEDVIKVANKLMYSNKFDLVIATKDYHPKGHISFASSKKGGVWPDHCLAGSPGSEFPFALEVEKMNMILHKGTNIKVDSYSAFLDANKRDTGLTGFIINQPQTSNREVYIMGLATDYCVLSTALDCPFDKYVIKDGCRAVDINPDDGKNAFKKMKECGCKIINSKDILNG